MRAIIDARQHGLPDAPTFYRYFGREPSPAGDITVEADKIEALQAIDLVVLMDHILAAMNPGRGGPGEKEFLIVCHAFQAGLLIPLAPKTDQFATQSQLELLMTMDVAQKDRDKILAMPSSTEEQKNKRLAAWKALFDGPPQKVNITGAFTEEQAQAAFRSWLENQAKRMNISLQTSLGLISRMNRVRSGALLRLEFRACNVGGNPSALETLKKFFGSGKIVAPKTETFFLNAVPPNVLPDSRRISEFAASPTGPFSGRAAERLRTADLAQRKLDVPIPLCGFHTICMLVSVFLFAVKIWEVAAFEYRWASATTSTSATQMFLNQAVKPGFSYSGGAFPLAGFWTLGTLGRTEPFILPNDSDYRDMIVVHGV